MDDHTVTYNFVHRIFQRLVLPWMFHMNVFKETFINICTTTWTEKCAPDVVQMQQYNHRAVQMFVLLIHEWVFGYYQCRLHSFLLFSDKSNIVGVNLCRCSVVVVKRLMRFTYLPNYTAPQPRIPTNSMEQSPFWEANSPSSSQETSSISYNLKVHYRVQHGPLPVPALSQVNSVHATSSFFLRTILIPSSYLCLCLPRDLFPSCLPHQNPVCTLHFPIRVTCPADLIIFNSITRIILCKYNSWKSPSVD
jgi:hypothetical protein